jgi:putative endonuclease
MSKKYLGSIGEKIALKYYLANDFVLLAKNYLTRYGELDLVLAKNNVLYGIEVKTRTSHVYGFAEEAINQNKIEKMRKTCYIFDPQAEWSLEIITIYLQGKQAKIRRFPICDY